MPQDDSIAFDLLCAAAEQGLPNAQYRLALMCSWGNGVPQDDEMATKWYTAAARQGHATAQFKLGRMYRDGDTVDKNYVDAWLWFALAGANGHPDAKEACSDVGSWLTRDQWEQCEREVSLGLDRLQPGFAS